MNYYGIGTNKSALTEDSYTRLKNNRAVMYNISPYGSLEAQYGLIPPPNMIASNINKLKYDIIRKGRR